MAEGRLPLQREHVKRALEYVKKKPAKEASSIAYPSARLHPHTRLKAASERLTLDVLLCTSICEEKQQ